MTALKHDFEVVPDDTTLTGGSGGNTNVGSSNYFDAVDTTVAGAECKGTATNPYQNTRCMKVRLGANAGTACVEWDASFAAINDFYVCLYFNTIQFAAGGDSCRVIECRLDGGGALQGGVHLARVSTNNRIRVFNNTGATVVTGTSSFTAGAWHRLEAFIHCDTTASPAGGYVTARFFEDPTATTPTEELNAAGATAKWVNGGNVGNVLFGAVGAPLNFPSATATDYVYIDGIAAGQTSDWYGPQTFGNTYPKSGFSVS